MDDAGWLALREVCLRGVCPVDLEHAAELTAAGFARETPRGLMATAEGRTALEQWARLPTECEAQEVALRTYAAFQPLDRELKQIAADWQGRAAGKRATLDHDDWKIVDRLSALD